MFERVVTVVGSIEPLSSIPQTAKVWQLQSTNELSLFSWAFGVFATSLWLIYAIKKRSIALVLSSFLWIAVDLPVVVAILLYS